MSNIRIGNSLNQLTVDTRRPRQTPTDSSGFARVLRGGADILLSGAAAATQVMGLPTLSAAISRVQADNPSDNRLPNGSTNIGQVLGEAMPQTLGAQGISDDLQLLAMQEQIQRQNRQISMVSNVLKARHDTAKAAIGNLRG